MRDLGDRQNVQYLAVDPYTGAATDATVVLTVTAPDATTSTPTVTHPATGDYRSNFALGQVGKWRWVWDVSGTIVDKAYGEVDVADPSPPLYATLADLKQIRPTPAANVDIDAALSRALQTASRRIDRATGERQFWLDRVVTARIFHTRERVDWTCDGEWLRVDDIGSTAGLIVETGDGTTWTAVAAGDYQTGPDNALARRKPITKLLRKLTTWSTGANSQVRVTALWGWPSIPDEIPQATLLLANRLYLRKDSPEGILGNAEWGIARLARTDPDVAELIYDLCLPGIA